MPEYARLGAEPFEEYPAARLKDVRVLRMVYVRSTSRGGPLSIQTHLALNLHPERCLEIMGRVIDALNRGSMPYKWVLGLSGEGTGGGLLIEAGARRAAAETSHRDEVRTADRGRYWRTTL